MCLLALLGKLVIEFKNAVIRRDGRVLVQGASINLHRGQKIGLTGNNGAGKSTLFAVILGQFAVDSGDFGLPKDWQIAHMAQEVQASEQTALDYVLAGDSTWYELNAKMHKQATLSPDEIAVLHEQFELIDGYRTPAKAAEVLSGLGFSEAEHAQAVASFSGGWRMRLNLARTLMHRADLLLLDEPTNHLDLDAILWLEEWLIAYDGLVLVISHDQAFLDSVVGYILHIERQQITLYSGNYSQFLRTRSERLAQAQSAYAKQEATKNHLEAFIRRFGAKASKAKQAQSRMKQLERMVALSPVVADNPFSFQFYDPAHTASPLFKLDNASIGYDKPLITNVTLAITPETRLGILGANGAGKSTLIKALVGELPLLDGQWLMAETTKLGYFNQHQMDALDLSATPMVLMRRLAGTTPDDKLRAFLGSFDFRGDKVDTTIALFSGGERARLTLALIVWQRPNVLVLDEPTNHLDLQMRDALMLALQAFTGALVLVSHDRELILSVCDELLLVGQGQAVAFTGDMNDYAQHLKQMRLLKAKQNAVVNTSQAPPKKELTKEELRKKNAELRQKTAPLRKAVADLEIKLDALSAQATSIEEQLADTALYEESNKGALLLLLEEQTSLTVQISQTEEALMDTMGELEELENTF